MNVNCADYVPRSRYVQTVTRKMSENMPQKISDRVRFWELIENIKGYLIIFIIATVLLFFMLGATTEGQGFHIILLFSMFFAFVLTLGIWAYRKFQEVE